MKDARGSGADSAAGPVVQAVRRIKALFPRVLVACDVCLCAYTSHGHCGIIKAEDGYFDIEASAARIGEVALAYAQAGQLVMRAQDTHISPRFCF